MNNMGFWIAVSAFLLVSDGWNHAHAENVDPDANGAHFAYGENIGWLNGEPQGDGGPGLEVADFMLTGWMWSENAGWISLSCENTANCATQDYGVKNDGQGQLDGYAWAENLGWIDFGAATAGVTIDPVTGLFSGKAWSENTGWISFDGATFAMKTAWNCSPAPPVPADPIELALQKSGTDALFSWPAIAGASAYDLARGDLGLLRSSGGDFSVATDSCLASKDSATLQTDGDLPATGEGFWYLARGANCSGPGSYDSAGLSQDGSRDAEIDAAPGSCP